MLDLLPDLCDEFPEQVRVLHPVFTSYGAKSIFSGEVVTVKCFEDNSVVKSLVNQPGKGRVIVVDGGGSVRKALLGDMLAQAAADNGWAGLVINGAIRDAGTIATINIGVQALNTIPVKTEKLGAGNQDVDIEFAGQVIKPGSYIYADLNGVLVTDKPLNLN
ncbi:putative 4-hydroxy-4-methyl-2-oxoglutarate aldolase [Psychrobium sp. 1_MG-2023]|uniref:putative 4-hydroxy-4-methyl-2-oxoglutarate aldolase n=1 Tax=Psychrobium sp. 1_MG-2023 TaxID=3062624 RepID=UPI000C326149|nr:putative 4-hydroxy-4-methyl-2-oxoglutarate aldolase [Psychrobium sp. 1_MG-2023]MDP2561691.1 putative 4-hydroxy-4-methyl-2-oxoglutarate aldolase [Psychrobium sp. 1_MG-2023]PKF57094.1 ribonuclease activity regulator protein RraA [Alteromonadales bacterium alter-6D02]